MKRHLPLIAVAAMLALGGCGGHSDRIDSTPPTPTTPTTPTTPPVSMTDAFFDAVLRIVGVGDDASSEPVATDSIVATAPENTEPATVK